MGFLKKNIFLALYSYQLSQKKDTPKQQQNNVVEKKQASKKKLNDLDRSCFFVLSHLAQWCALGSKAGSPQSNPCKAAKGGCQGVEVAIRRGPGVLAGNFRSVKSSKPVSDVKIHVYRDIFLGRKQYSQLKKWPKKARDEVSVTFWWCLGHKYFRMRKNARVEELYWSWDLIHLSWERQSCY